MNGKDYWFAPFRASESKAALVSAHLLSIYDEYVSGYKDRSAIISTKNGARLVAMGNALNGIIVMNGQIVGTWKRMMDDSAVKVRLDLFSRLKNTETSALHSALEKYSDFLAMRVELQD
jgi:hypothetical protein